jgi:hypothetical protein
MSVHYCPSHKPLGGSSTFIQKETASGSNFEVTFHKEPENFSDITPELALLSLHFRRVRCLKPYANYIIIVGRYGLKFDILTSS